MPRAYRSPWPNDIVFAGVGLMLGLPDPKKPGAPLVLTKPQDLSQVAPPTYGYDAAPPTVERVQEYASLAGGFGQKFQGAGPTDTRYYYALNADCSAGQPWQKGPLVTTVTPGTVDATNGISGFVESGPGTRLFALNGRYCLYRQDDATWPVSKDFGVGQIAADAITFFSNALGQQYIYVGLGDATLMWRYDETSVTTNWVQHGTLKSRAFTVAGRDLWRASGNTLAKVDTDSDPWTAANWSAANSFSIGDQAWPISRLVTTIAGTLVALKPDGPYTLDAEGNDHQLYPYLRFGSFADDGTYFGEWQNDLYLSYGRSVLRIKPTLTFSLLPHLPVEEIGPERIIDNDSPIHGQPTASAGHEDFNLFQGIWNPDTNTSYLLKFGGWGQDPQTGQPARAEVWHGSITAAFVGKKLTAMHVSTIGAPSGHKRLYLGFGDGTISYFVLPCAPNPMACSQYLYSTSVGTIYLPIFDGHFRNDPKVLKAFTVTGLNLSTADFVNLQAAANPGDAYANVTDGAALGVGNTINFNENPRQKVWLPGATSGPLLRFAVLLQSSDQTSPQVSSVGVHYAVRPWYGLSYEFDVLADRFVTKRDGTLSRLAPADVQTLLRTAAQATAPIAVTLPDESVAQMAIVGYGESMAWSERLRRWHESIHVSAVDFTPIQVLQYGTWQRLSAYTWAELHLYTWAELQTL